MSNIHKTRDSDERMLQIQEKNIQLWKFSFPIPDEGPTSKEVWFVVAFSQDDAIAKFKHHMEDECYSESEIDDITDYVIHDPTGVSMKQCVGGFDRVLLV